MHARLERLRWIGVPIGAYLLITLVLPAAHGAGGRSDFAHHAALVLAGCAFVAACALLIDLLWRQP